METVDSQPQLFQPNMVRSPVPLLSAVKEGPGFASRARSARVRPPGILSVPLTDCPWYTAVSLTNETGPFFSFGLGEHRPCVLSFLDSKKITGSLVKLPVKKIEVRLEKSHCFHVSSHTQMVGPPGFEPGTDRL